MTLCLSEHDISFSIERIYLESSAIRSIRFDSIRYEASTNLSDELSPSRSVSAYDWTVQNEKSVDKEAMILFFS